MTSAPLKEPPTREALIDGPESAVDSNLSSMRLHELALKWWCHTHFLVTSGYPVPVVFSKPMDAYSHFTQLWSKAENPFSYLLDAKDKDGRPLYQPYPEPARLPLISINRKRQSFRNYGTFSTRRRRYISWPTVSSDVKTNDLASARVRNRPMGINFHLDVSHWCLRPDTQALFMQRVWNCFWRSGGAPQTWILVRFPTEERDLMVRMALESDVVDATSDEPGQEQVKYCTSFSVKIEGWQVDMRDLVVPTLWHLKTNLSADSVDFETLSAMYSVTEDLRNNVEDPTCPARTSQGPPVSEAPKITFTQTRYLTDELGNLLLDDNGVPIIVTL